jgi:hypothetical protein
MKNSKSMEELRDFVYDHTSIVMEILEGHAIELDVLNAKIKELEDKINSKIQ